MSDTYQLIKNLEDELSKARRECLNNALLLKDTRARLEVIKQERDGWERNCKAAMQVQPAFIQNTRPEPSQLEIAAMIYAAWQACHEVYPGCTIEAAVKCADELIAEARKEVAK
jgi:hypothetical protein